MVVSRACSRSKVMALRIWVARQPEAPPAEREWNELRALRVSGVVKEFGDASGGGEGGCLPFSAHELDSFVRIEVKAVGEKGFSRLCILSLLGKHCGLTSVVCSVRSSISASSLWSAGCLLPKFSEAVFTERVHAG